MKEVYKNLAENVLKLRTANKMTQSELAQRLNYTDKAVSKWERGETTPPLDVIKSIADLFGVSVDMLISDVISNEGCSNETVKNKNRNRLIISFLSVLIVWLLASFGFAVSMLTGGYYPWRFYIYAVPVSAIVLTVFSAIWGTRKHVLLYVSILIWSALASLCFLLIRYKIWIIFVLGVPLQLAVILWSGFKTSKLKNKALSLFKPKRKDE